VLDEHRSSTIDPSQCRTNAAKELRRITHETIKKVTSDVEGFRFNTAIAALMTLTNQISTYPGDQDPEPLAAATRILIQLLGVFAPHLCEELWEQIGTGGRLHEQSWPEVDSAALVRDTIEIAVQVNGKFVTSITAPATSGEEELQALAVAENHVARRLAGKKITRMIRVPGRLVNLLVR
jgi:leucyl-tRNA synthetase